MTQGNDERIGYWNDPAVAADLKAASPGVSEFAREVEARLPRHCRVLELGCGPGDDASYFAEQGHLVLGLDFSEPLIAMAAQRFADQPELEFRRADITQPLHIGAESCDAVYARLSLQYFDFTTTERIFGEVFWVLRPAGSFYFLCRSTSDPFYGKGTEVAADTYDYEGSVRHFFSRDYSLDLMEDAGFTDVEIRMGTDRFYGRPSAYVLCSGRKP